MTTEQQPLSLRPDLQRVASQIPDGAKVLDLGCGEGELLAYLLEERGCVGTGVERDNELVLKAIGSGVPLVAYDLDTQLGEFSDDSYDIVVLSRTLQAVLHPVQLLREMSRIAPKMIVTMPNFGYWKHRITLVKGHMPRSRDLPFSWYDTPNLHHSTLVDLEVLFDTVGLHVEKRIPLKSSGHECRWGQRWANLMASSAIYVLARQ